VELLNLSAHRYGGLGMADVNTGEFKQIVKLLPIEWPEVGVAMYANQLMAQCDGRSMYLTFCQTNPPAILGTPEEQRQKLEEIKSIKAIPIVKLMIPLDVFRDMQRVVQEAVDRSKSRVENVSPARSS
jgi:hypothetical protein